MEKKTIGGIIGGSILIFVLPVILIFMLINTTNEGSDKKYYNEQKMILSQVENKFNKILVKMILEDPNRVSFTPDAEFKRLYNDYLVSLNRYNKTVVEVRENLKDKGLICDFCRQKEQGYKIDFE